MKHKASLKTRLKILKLIIDNKEYAQYDMSKAIGKDYRTILRHIQSMEKANLIQLARMEPGQKKGIKKKIYTITLRGLHFFMFYMRDEINALEEIINKFPNILLSFRKWNLFVEAGLKEKMLHVLREAFYSSYIFAYQAIAAGFQVKLSPEERIRQTVDYQILYTPLFGEIHHFMNKLP